MRDAWDELGATYNFSHAVSIAEVDCSRFVTHPPEPDGTIRSRESLCGRYNIKSYPTVITFTGETGTSGERYKGKQTYEAMHAFLEKVSDPGLLDDLAAGEAFGRAAEPWEVANVMVFLASDLAGYMTGEIVSVSSQHP